VDQGRIRRQNNSPDGLGGCPFQGSSRQNEGGGKLQDSLLHNLGFGWEQQHVTAGQIVTPQAQAQTQNAFQMGNVPVLNQIAAPDAS